MTAVHLHLLINHAPLLTALAGLALLAAGLGRRSSELTAAALVALLLAALLGGVSFLSGERAEHTVEDLPGTDPEILERHEEAAETARLGLIAQGLVALGALLRLRRPRERRWWLGLAAAAGLITALLLARTMNIGGQVRHPEVRTHSGRS